MRAREFLMKDAYSFHLDHGSLQQTYEAMYNAYCRIFERLGLTYRAVEADTGAIGGSASHEFQVLADSGEDIIFYSDKSNYAANVEKATSLPPQKQAEAVINKPIEIIDTPNCKTIPEVCNFLGINSDNTVKTLIVEGVVAPFVALVLRGDDTLNEVKVSKHPLIKLPLRFADDQIIGEKLGMPIGFVGPINLTIPVIVDYHALAMEEFVCGANIKDKHSLHVKWERDATYTDAFDLRSVREGDLSPDGQGILKSCRGIEVGHVFQLGDKYAKAMNAEVINEEGQLQTLTMGCYGLGISRVVAAAIEQHHDDKGILWPQHIAPFQLVIIPLNGHRNTEVQQFAEDLYQNTINLGIDVLIDDRNERPGVLFADHDLIGIPHRIVISERNLTQKQVEYKARQDLEARQVPLDEALEFIRGLFFKV
jgi:prolyl-tRNA synthetase